MTREHEEPRAEPARRPIVGVMGSGQRGHDSTAAPLGRYLAEQGFHLLTGGGGGVMAAVSRAFHAVPDRAGSVIGVLPSRSEDPLAGPKHGYPNEWVEIPIQTHLPLSGSDGESPLSRNHINVLTSDVVLVLPGGEGTASEAALALRYRKPTVAVALHDDDPPTVDSISVVHSLEELREFLRSALPDHAPA